MDPHVLRLRGARALLAVLLLVTTIASAQPSAAASEPAEYYARIEQAVHEYELGRWLEAYASFQRAHDLAPNARTLRGLALTAFKLTRYVETERHIQAALASDVKPLTEVQRAELLQLLEWTRRYIDHIELMLQPQTARASIDGVELTSPSLALDAGEHQLTVRAKGYVTRQQRLVVVGGRELQISVSLPPIEVSVKPTSPIPAPAPASSSSLWASPWLWTAVGVVVATGAVAFAVTRDGDVKPMQPYRGGDAFFMVPAQ
jgi:hypothetical protein